jgi:WD40 repeat protein/tRNA A-37 threonylcarbamoyl transferase component Bud32
MSEITTSDWTWINAAADRFERAWKQGPKPRIEEFLAGIDESRWPRQLKELLRVESELRRLDGEEPSLEEYSLRFPEHAALIAAFFTRESAFSAGRDTTTTAPGMTGSQSDLNGEPAPGTRLRYFGDYELIHEIGRGGMGVVYKARQISLNRPVALKMIRSAALASEDELRRFQNEAEAVATLDHTHIVPILEVGNHNGQRYFSMKLIGGPGLDKKLTDYLAQPKAAASLLMKAAEAVHHAHQRGILHRDLKPANILLDERGAPFVADFGLAKRVASDSELTYSGAIMGTPAYMAPEQASGRRGAVTTSSDVYGLGAILYSLLTGRAPFGGDSIDETLEQVRESAPSPPSKINPRVPRDLELICLKCLEKDSAERYPTATALAADLGRFAAGAPVSVRPAGVVERAAKWARRNPTLAAAYALGLMAVLLGGLGGAALWQWRAAEKARDGEKRARAAAEGARDTAEFARVEAVTARIAEKEARGEAERRREMFERFDYGRTIQVAHQEWREANVVAALALLDGTRAELRGWEWRFLNRLCRSDSPIPEEFSHTLLAAMFNPDGSRVVSGNWVRSAKVWSAESGAEVLNLTGHIDGINSVSFSPDGSRVIVACDDNTARVWDVKRGAELLTLWGHSNCVKSATFSPDGSRILTGSDDSTAKIWDAKSGIDVFTLKGHTRVGSSASFNPDGSRIVTWGKDKTAKVWDAKTRAEVLTLKGHTGYVTSASFSPDGSRVVTASSDGTAKIWDANSGAEVLTLRGHTHQVNSASFSPDGSRVVTGSADLTAKIWDARLGAEFFTLKGHTGLVSSASFSPDGSRVLTGSWDNTAMVWDAKSGALVLTLKGHTGRVSSASFSPDGSVVVTGSDDGTAKVWDATPLTPELLANRDAVGVVETLFDQKLSVAEVIDRIRHRSTIDAEVRNRALALAESQGRVLAARKVEQLVRSCFDRLLFREDVLETLRANATLSEPARAHALALAERYSEDSHRLNYLSWHAVRCPDGTRASYLQALHLAEAACRIDPNNGYYLNTLGVAQYRAGQYQVALTTLTRSNQLNSQAFEGSIPDDLAFLALTHFRLGELDKASSALGLLREAMKKSDWAQSADGRAFLREAEAIKPELDFPANPFAP